MLSWPAPWTPVWKGCLASGADRSQVHTSDRGWSVQVTWSDWKLGLCFTEPSLGPQKPQLATEHVRGHPHVLQALYTHSDGNKCHGLLNAGAPCHMAVLCHLMCPSPPHHTPGWAPLSTKPAPLPNAYPVVPPSAPGSFTHLCSSPALVGSLLPHTPDTSTHCLANRTGIGDEAQAHHVCPAGCGPGHHTCC